MNIVIGVSDIAQGELAQRALRDLGFSDPHLEFAYVVEIWTDPTGGTTTMPMQSYFDELQAEAHDTLEDMQIKAKEYSIPSTTHLLYGDVSNELMNQADKSKADLLVLGSFGRGRVESLLLGSVGRKALINAHQSVLIVKDDYWVETGLKVVIATDHSPYSHRCLDLFLSWRPTGIKHITLVTIAPDDIQEALEARFSHFKADANQLLQDGLAHENARLLEKFRVLPASCESRVESGDVNAVLNRVMEQSGADLLILGSQGHGFFERMRIGSISLQQATQQSYSTLVLRI